MSKIGRQKSTFFVSLYLTAILIEDDSTGILDVPVVLCFGPVLVAALGKAYITKTSID